MSKRAWVAAVAAVGLLGVGCGSPKTETTGASSPATSSSAATSTTQASETKTSGYQPFSPATDPCSLVTPEQLGAQGAAPINSRARDSNGIQQCTYQDADHNKVLNLKLFKNADGATNFRDIHVRILQADGAEIYVMKDEQNECGAALLGPEDNIVQFDFEPGTAAVSAAQVQTGQTWCDFSAPVIAEANKKLGWAK
ncbi:DUF3558 family protein [Mycobacteroides franklinii]|uniref:DUF3558 family protein n=1 Tax=Mycobacteroides franklinii TaxID=948102 RepID=UPI0009918E8F|nr:DUF3558 family protein [Mycobacteroides franklinii]